MRDGEWEWSFEPLQGRRRIGKVLGEAEEAMANVRRAIEVLMCARDLGSFGMPDDKLNRGEPDRSKINMSEDYEVKYWTQHLGVTKDELQKVVDR